MSRLILIFFTSILLWMPNVIFARIVTIEPGTINIETNETAELLGTTGGVGGVVFNKPDSPYYFDIPDKIKNINFRSPVDSDFVPRIRMIAGPATIQCTGGYATFRITPQEFPVEKTAIIPHLSKGATVTLQVSNNLMDWTTAANGIYSGTNGPLFFRINLVAAP